MDETLIEQGFLWFFGALFAGPLIGWLIGLKGGFERGLAVGCLVIGLTGSYFAIATGIDRAAQLRDTVVVQGRLREFVEEISKDSDGKQSVNYAPRVAYVAADGVERSVKGLGGSQQSQEIGAPVAVRYRSDKPEQAIIADFQNTWGPVLAFGIFGGFPLLFGLFFLLQGLIPEKKNVSRLPAPSDKGRLVWARYATISANLTLLSAFFVMGLSRYAVLPTIGAGFCVVAAGCLNHLLAEFIRPERNWQRVMILLIVASGFAVFGVVGLLLGLEI